MSGGGDQTNLTNQNVQPYAPTAPALNQIISEAGTIYNQGPRAAGYVAPTTQTLQGIAAQEVMANAANQQMLNTIQGQYSNPFLSPLITTAANNIYSSVAQQFSGAGRTPGSPLMQSAVIGQVADYALPYAFSSYEGERGRQLGTARDVPSLTQVGGSLEELTRQQNMAPQQSLAQYYNTISPIAFRLPVQQASGTRDRPNSLGMAIGGALAGRQIGNYVGQPGMGAAIGGLGGLLGGLL